MLFAVFGIGIAIAAGVGIGMAVCYVLAMKRFYMGKTEADKKSAPPICTYSFGSFGSASTSGLSWGAPYWAIY